MEKTYMHTGIPVAEKMEGMNYMPGLKVWICNNTRSSICTGRRTRRALGA